MGTQKVTAKTVEWSDSAAKALREAMREGAAVIESQVKDGDAVLWQFSGGVDGYAVVRIEDSDKRELVLVAGAGSGLLSGLQILWGHYKELAGVERVRTHVEKLALLRLYNRNEYGLKFRVKELVLEGEYGR